MSATIKSVYATLPFTERARAMVLNGDPKGKNFLYTNGKHVIIRDINNPGIAETYSQHSVQATVAQYSPSGYYIASGDVSGKVRIWDTVNKEHILKFEAQPFSGPVRDLCWDGESKRIAVGGEGREVYGAVFMWDSGSSLGKIIGHTKQVNSISFKHTRPFRIATASEDQTVCFYEGPPFKHKRSFHDHSNFVNCIRFSPSGSHFCSVGSDKKAFLYDGKTGDPVGPLGGGTEAHKGGIYSVCWSPDGSQLLTASADKTCKLWDVATQQEVSLFTLGSTVNDQQLGCIWQGDHILSCSLSGNINYLDKNNPDTPIRVIEGQNKNLNCICAAPDGSYIFCGSNDGRISYWNTATDIPSLIKGKGHAGQMVCSLAATQENLYSLGLDKALRQSPLSTFEYSSDAVSFPDRDPKCLAISPDRLAIVGTLTDLSLVRDGKLLQTVPFTEQAYCAAFNPVKAEVAVGSKDSKVSIYSTENDSLTKVKDIELSNCEVNAVDYNPTGEVLAVTGSSKKTILFNVQTSKDVSTFYGHTARVTGLKFSSDGKYIATCGIDTNIAIHNVEKESSEVIRGAHPLSIINGITWVNDSTFASCGDDCCIRVWEFNR